MAAAAVEQNLRECFRTIARERPAGEVRETGGITIASSGATFQMFNAAFLATPVLTSEDFERRAALAEVHFRARGLDWSFWLCENMLDRPLRRHTRRVLERRKLLWSVDLPGMTAEAIAPPRRVLPDLVIRRVADHNSRLAFCDIGSTCFGVPLSWFREIFLWEPAWSGALSGWVGYSRGEPICTAAIVAAGGAMGLYNVATLPAHRRRGYAEVLMRRALAETSRETGLSRIVLQSTPDGEKLYSAMGFRTVTRVSVYASAG